MYITSINEIPSASETLSLHQKQLSCGQLTLISAIFRDDWIFCYVNLLCFF